MAMWHSGHVSMFAKIAQYGKTLHHIVGLQWAIGNSCCLSQSLDLIGSFTALTPYKYATVYYVGHEWPTWQVCQIWQSLLENIHRKHSIAHKIIVSMLTSSQYVGPYTSQV